MRAVFPGRVGPAGRRIPDPDDVRDVIAPMRLNYDRVTGCAAGRLGYLRPDIAKTSQPAPRSRATIHCRR